MVDDEVEQLLQVMDAGFPAVQDMSPQEARDAVAARRAPVDNIDDVASATDELIEDRLRVRIYRPHDQQTKAPGVVFAHGGGFVLCSIESHDGFCRRLSRGTGAVVVSVDYRLAPEHPAPAGASDMHTAVRWLVDNADRLGVDPDALLVAGDSAGGNLAAVTALLCREQGPALTGQVLIQPVITPDFSSPSYQAYATGFFNTRAAMQWYWEQNLSDGWPEPAYLADPMRADLTGLPPAIMISGSRDVLASEDQAYADALARAGVPTVHRCYQGLFHGFLTIGPLAAAESARQVLWRDIAALLEGES